MKRYRLIIFDRDGTLNYEDQNYHRDLLALRPYPFSGQVLRALKADGYLLALATNQSGIAHGLWSRDEVEQLHRRFFADWGLELPVYMCPHLPGDACVCRKPQPGLLLQALTDHDCDPGAALMVGDSTADAGAARNAGVDFALVLTGRGKLTRPRLTSPPAMFLDTVAALEGSLSRHAE